jgi:hypothetical protein
MARLEGGVLMPDRQRGGGRPVAVAPHGELAGGWVRAGGGARHLGRGTVRGFG